MWSVEVGEELTFLCLGDTYDEGKAEGNRSDGTLGDCTLGSDTVGGEIGGITDGALVGDGAGTPVGVIDGTGTPV